MYVADSRTNQKVAAQIYKFLPMTKSVGIGYVIVDENYRGKHIGTLMFRYVEEKVARKNGAKIIFSDTNEPIDKIHEQYNIKNGYYYAKVPFILIDEPPATYLLVKPISVRLDEITPQYLKELYREYLENVYSVWERVYRSKDIVPLVEKYLDELVIGKEKIEFTHKRFLKDVDEKYKNKLSKYLDPVELEEFINEYFRGNKASVAVVSH